MPSRNPGRMKATLTIDEAAKRHNLHSNSVYRWAQRGIIPVRRIGGVWRVDRDNLEDFLRTSPCGPDSEYAAN